MDEPRRVGDEASKSHQLRLENGFIDAYLSGEHVLDIGYKGYTNGAVPITPRAIGIEFDCSEHEEGALPFADGSQDAVFASHCLEHVPDFAMALRDWFRVLRAGGFLVIMVPHQFLYEKRATLPSQHNADHQRFYTPASLMADIEGVLRPNSYRLRHLVDNDRDFDYTLPPDRRSGGCYEIELVIERITAPPWSIVTRAAPIGEPRYDAVDAVPALDALHERDSTMQRIHMLPASPLNLAVYDFGGGQPQRRRILAMQLGHFGDFIIGLPALRQLRALFPDDHIRLVVGTWNRGVAERCGLADAVVTHDLFPETVRDWDGKPVQSAREFSQAARGRFDIALDLRVDEDTRHLLEQVDAVTRCGVGTTARFPYLDIALPLDRASRHTDHGDQPLDVMLGPERFTSRMPVQAAFKHETDFSVTDTHLVYGPYISLRRGRFRATYGLQLTKPRFGRGKLMVKVDVLRGGADVLAERELSARDIPATDSGGVQLDFSNAEDCAPCEFRVFARGRPWRAKLAFRGVKLDQLDVPTAPRLRRADLHIGEQLSLLVQLVADRTRPPYPAPEQTDPALPPDLRLPPARYRVVVAPVSNSDLRDWPIEHYVALVSLLVGRLGCTVLLIGSRPQAGALAHIAQASGGGQHVVNLGGRTAWGDIPAILRGADLVICNNSGIAHLAASIGTRTLAVYSASHQPQEWGPRGERSRALMAMVACSPCGYYRLAECPHDHACMQGLLPEAVFTQAANWLGGE